MPNFLANRAFVNTAEMLNFTVDDTDEDMLGPFILPTNNDDYKIVVWRRYSTKNIDNLTSYPANGPGRWIVLAGSTSNTDGNNNNVTEMIQFATLAALKAYTTPSTEVLYCLSETGKPPVFFVWNATSTQAIDEPIIVKLNTITTGRMTIESASVIVSNIRPTGTPPLPGINYLWKENDIVNTYDSLIEYTSTATEWTIKSGRVRKDYNTPDSINISPNFEGEFFIDTTASVLYVGLNGGWTIINGAGS